MTQQPMVRQARLLTLASYASVATALLLIAVKLMAWLLTGSMSILASLVDSLMDSIASLINLVAIRYSLQPADAEHRFGHGKAEPLAGLCQAAFICGSAGFLILHAIDRLRHPIALQAVGIGVAVMIFAIVLTLSLLLLQRHVIAQTGSTAIRADAVHYASDLLSNLAIIAALLIAPLGWPWVDPLFALGVAVYIGYHAMRVGQDAIQQLLDRELPPQQQQQIQHIASHRASVRGVHDLRTRQSGRVVFVQLHLELDDNLPLYQAHAIADQVALDICEVIPTAQVIVHQDPASAVAKAPLRVT